MKTNELFTLIITTIEAGLAVRQIEAGVYQNFQPTQQGVSSQPSVFLYKVADRRYGYLKRNDKWVPATVSPAADGYMAHEENQWMESTFQISALAIQDPSLTNALTASDLCDTVASILQGDAGREALQAQGVGMLRVTAIRNPAFTDDRDRNEFAPNFDFTVTHQNVILSTNPTVDTFEFDLRRV